MGKPTFMGEPTLWGALRSVLTNSDRPLQVAFTLPEGHSWEDLEYRLSKLEALVADLQTAHQSSVCIILIFIDLSLAFLADWPIVKLLRACGIENPAALSGQDPKVLHERMESMNKKAKRPFVNIVPRRRAGRVLDSSSQAGFGVGSILRPVRSSRARSLWGF